jgi:hypothetical protein
VIGLSPTLRYANVEEVMVFGEFGVFERDLKRCEGGKRIRARHLGRLTANIYLDSSSLSLKAREVSYLVIIEALGL